MTNDLRPCGWVGTLPAYVTEDPPMLRAMTRWAHEAVGREWRKAGQWLVKPRLRTEHTEPAYWCTTGQGPVLMGRNMADDPDGPPAAIMLRVEWRP